MQTKHLLLTVLELALILSVLAAGAAYAFSSLGYDLAWWTVDAGGGSSSGSGYTLSGSIGQPDAGSLSGGTYHLQGGFWTGGPTLPPAPSNKTIYLPLLNW